MQEVLSSSFAGVPLWRKVDDLTIEVNLDKPPKLPFDQAEVAWIAADQTGWVQLQRRGDELFLYGKHIEFYLTEGQKTGIVRGHDLREQLQGKVELHSNVLDALLENTHLLPESWKVDGRGQIRNIFFRAVGFQDSNSGQRVRYLYWRGGQWRCSCRWLANEFDAKDPAAVVW